MKQRMIWMSSVVAAAAAVAMVSPRAEAQLLAGVDEDAEFVRLYDFTRGRWVRQFMPLESVLATAGDGPSGLAVDDAGGVIWWSDGSNLYRSDYGSRATTFVAQMTFNGAAQSFTGLEFVNGVLYGSDNAPAGAPEGIYSIDTTTGVTTLVLDMTDPDGLYSFKALAYNPLDGLFYVASEGLNPNPRGLFSIDVLGTGAVNFITPYAGVSGENGDVEGLAIGVQGGVARAYFVHDEVGEYAVYNLSTGMFETPLPSLPLEATEFNGGAAWAPGLVAPVVDSDLVVRIFDAPDFVIAGNQLTYTVEVENNGSTPLSGVVVTTTLDGDVAYASSTLGSHDGAPAGGVHTANVGAIPALGQVTYEVVVTVVGNGTLVSSVSGSAAQADPDTSNNTASTETEALAVPINDQCENAIALSCGSVVTGDTRAATPESLAQCGTTNGTAGAVWYTIEGTGQAITASTCSAATNFNTRLRVWEGSCAGLTCVAGNDTDMLCGSGVGTQAATVTFQTSPGTTYYILVHGAFANVGQFELSIDCEAGRGACCVGGACTVVTEAECAAMEGAYQGDNSTCPAPTIANTEPGEFIDISGTGTLLNLVDNEVRTVATNLLGDILVGNDGAVAYGSSAGLLISTNNAFPTMNFFGGVVEGFAAHWDDLGIDLGAVYVQELADRVIVQYDQRAHVPSAGLDEGITFQVQLFAPLMPYRAQYIYTDTLFDPDYDEITECSFGGCDDGLSATIGWQDEHGRFLEWFGGVMGRPCPCEYDGASGVDVFDLLAYLDLWFSSAAGADIDGTPGVDVFDLLAYLDCWFPASAGQPCGQTEVITILNATTCP